MSNHDYITRQLASMVLEGDRGPRGPGIADAGHAVVTVEMRGMIRGIRREILLDHAELAGRVADEIEKQTAEINLDAIIAEKVRAEILRARQTLDLNIQRIVSNAIDGQIREAANAAAKSVGRKVSRRLYDAAWPMPKPKKGRRK